MAPVLNHQSRQVILPPRPAKGPPGGARTVNNLINLKTFLMLLVGSFCIFILAVFIWKFGAFLRTFSRGKVVGGGKAASIRYAKTWHGWVPRTIYDNRMQIRKERLNRIRDKLAWRTSHADYSWVWWDPGGCKFHHYRRNQERLRIIPPQLLSYTFKGPDVRQADPVVLLSHSDSQRSEKKENSHRTNIYSYLKARGSALYKGATKGTRQLPTDPPDSNLRQASLDESNSSQPPNGIWTYAKKSFNALLAPLPFTYTVNRAGNAVVRSRSLPDGSVGNFGASRGFDTPAPRKAASEGQGGEDIRPRYFAPNFPSEKIPQISVPSAVWPKSNSWRFKAWGARMQRGTLINTPIYLRGLAGRPGTPVSGVLKAMVSSATYSGLARRTAQSIYPTHSSRSSTDVEPKPCSEPCALSDPIAEIHSQAIDVGGRLLEKPEGDTSGGQKPKLGHYLKVYHPRPSSLPRSISVHNIERPQGQNERPSLRRHLSNPEIRLMDDLNRKLDWLSSEMDPGRKPFHFAVCHNHWLNRATWVVLDPVSRVGVKTRRLYGDPRVNCPRPQHEENEPIRKYPKTSRGNICKPNLDSWRSAVNGIRKTAGAVEYLKIVELFEGSAEEVQEGAIDPASWVLKKPPQGYSLTRKQKDAYFEGCGGWCEKLDDWQQVPRAYRAKRVILEGKANRRRAAEVANAVGGNCRRAARKITPIWMSSAKHEKRSERRERSGRGLIKRRMSIRGRTQKAEKVSHHSTSSRSGSVNQGSQDVLGAIDPLSAIEGLDTG